MDPRNFNRWVVVKNAPTDQDEIGQPTGEGTVFARIRANVKFPNGSESIRADAVTSATRASIRIRYRTDVTTAMTLEYQSRSFNIVAVLPDEQSRRWTDLVCEEVDAAS